MDTPLSLRLQPAFCKEIPMHNFCLLSALITYLENLLIAIQNYSSVGLQITERKSTIYPAVNIIDAYYADDIAITANNLREANLLLHSI